MKKVLTAIVGVSLGALLAIWTAARAEDNFGSPELIAAAKAEGKMVLYTANFAEVEQDVIKEFNKRFPEIKVEMVRAPGGQLITRVRTEAAAGKLIADVVDHAFEPRQRYVDGHLLERPDIILLSRRLVATDGQRILSVGG